MAEAGAKSKEIEVNGIEVEARERKLTAHQILELAKEEGAMPGDPENYFLIGDKGRYEQNAEIDLEDDHRFITIPKEPTPVACFSPDESQH